MDFWSAAAYRLPAGATMATALNTSIADSILRVGVNYRFDPSGAIMAKYQGVYSLNRGLEQDATDVRLSPESSARADIAGLPTRAKALNRFAIVARYSSA
jgi:hypothetical protein